MMMCQCGFINGNKCTALLGHVDNWGGCACMGAGCMWEISISLNFAVNLSCSKNNVY